jgi:hypothetical protein
MWPFNRKKKTKGGTTVGENVCLLTIQLDPETPKKKIFKNLKKQFPFLTKEDFKEIEKVFSNPETTNRFVMTSPKDSPIEYDTHTSRGFTVVSCWGKDACNCPDTWTYCCGGPNFNLSTSRNIRPTLQNVHTIMGTVFPPSLQEGRNIEVLTLTRLWRFARRSFICYSLTEEDINFFKEADTKNRNGTFEGHFEVNEDEPDIDDEEGW